MSKKIRVAGRGRSGELSRWAAVFVALIVVVSACSPNVTASEEYLALQQERDDALEAQAEIEDQIESAVEDLDGTNEQIATATNADTANQETISRLEADLEDEKGRIAPYPQVFVDEFVVGCTEGDSALGVPCQCAIEELQNVMTIGEFFDVSVALLEVELDPETGLPLGDTGDVAGLDVFFDVMFDCFLFSGSNTGELGQIVVSAGEPIQIGSLLAVSGEVAFLGIPSERSVKLAVQDYGDVHGHSVSVETFDDLCSADGGEAGAQSVVSNPDVVGVIGTSCSGAAAGASPIISTAGFVMISPSNTSPTLTSDLEGNVSENYWPGYYRISHNDLIQGQVAAEFARNELGVSKVALIHDGDPYTNGITDAFASGFAFLGGQIVIHTSVSIGQTDMTQILTEVAQAGPELIFMPIFPEEATHIAQQVSGIGGLGDVDLMGADGLLVFDFLSTPETEGWYFAVPDLVAVFEPNEATGKDADEVWDAHIDDFGQAPTADYWTHAYDATTLLLSAIEAVGVADGDELLIDRAALRVELSNTSGFQGLTGVLTCDQFGDCSDGRSIVVLHIDSGNPDATWDNVVYYHDG